MCSLDEFNRMRLLAEILTGKKKHIQRVTNDYTVLDPYYQDRISQALKTPTTCFQGLTMSFPQDYCDIWINEQVSPPIVKSTVLHELSHVYAGVGCMHNPVWRNLYIRLTEHYSTFFDKPVDVCLYTMAQEVVRLYSRSHDLVHRARELNEVLLQAQEEQDKIFYKLEPYFAPSPPPV